MTDTCVLSVVIPARNEMFLARTIQDIIEKSEVETEIIATLDGAWAKPPVPQHDKVNLIYVPESVGQREATNLAARLARGQYIMKLDGHCAVEQGFDRKMIEAFDILKDDNVILVPIMRNLHAFDWKCYACGWKKYQGPTPDKCDNCGRTDKLGRKMMWIGKSNPQSWSYCFDSEPHFQYFQEYKNRPGVREAAKETGFTETMSLQGSCFMATREKYWELNLCGDFGSWGNQGIEVACRGWLSGGRVLVYHRTWYAHMFRTQGGDFSFPYNISGREVQKTKRKTWEFFINCKWKKQKYPVSWLVEKFWPVPGWTDSSLKQLKALEQEHVLKT